MSTAIVGKVMEPGPEMDLEIAITVLKLEPKRNRTGDLGLVKCSVTPHEGRYYLKELKGSDTYTDGLGYWHELCPPYSTDANWALKLVPLLPNYVQLRILNRDRKLWGAVALDARKGGLEIGSTGSTFSHVLGLLLLSSFAVEKENSGG